MTLPLFEYYCEPCQLKFEAIKPIRGREKAECPRCGKMADKVMSLVNHTFGWKLSDRCHERFGPQSEFVRDI